MEQGTMSWTHDNNAHEIKYNVHAFMIYNCSKTPKVTTHIYQSYLHYGYLDLYTLIPLDVISSVGTFVWRSVTQSSSSHQGIFQAWTGCITKIVGMLEELRQCLLDLYIGTRDHKCWRS